MSTFTFVESTNNKFDGYNGKPCRLGTDGKHALIAFADDDYITTTSVKRCSFRPGRKGALVYIHTRNSMYKVHCSDKDRALKAVHHLNDIAESTRLYANVVDEVQSGLSIGEALAHAISDQVRGQRRVIC